MPLSSSHLASPSSPYIGPHYELGDNWSVFCSVIQCSALVGYLVLFLVEVVLNRELFPFLDKLLSEEYFLDIFPERNSVAFFVPKITE